MPDAYICEDSFKLELVEQVPTGTLRTHVSCNDPKAQTFLHDDVLKLELIEQLPASTLRTRGDCVETG